MLRIVLLGPPLAGKMTLLRALADLRRGWFERFDAEGNIGVVAHVRLAYDDCEVATIPGCPWDAEKAWRPLLEAADAAALVLDPQTVRAEDNRVTIELVKERDGALKLGCVIVTKQDLASFGVSCVSAGSIIQGTRFEDWPVFPTRMDDPATMAQPLNWLFSRIEPVGPS